MLKAIRRLFQRRTQRLFDPPVLPVPAQPKPPAWMSTLSPVRSFKSEAEARAYARQLETAHLLAREASGKGEREAEAEFLQGFSWMFSERPR